MNELREKVKEKIGDAVTDLIEAKENVRIAEPFIKNGEIKQQIDMAIASLVKAERLIWKEENE